MNHKFLNVTFSEINSAVLLMLIYNERSENPIGVVRIAEFDGIEDLFLLEQEDLGKDFEELNDAHESYLAIIEKAKKELNGNKVITKAILHVDEVADFTRNMRQDNTTYQDITISDLQNYVMLNWTRSNAKDNTAPKGVIIK